jgi:hypothetical protein
MITGFEIVNQQLQISKDPEAILTYRFDWNQWLEPGDSLQTAVYTVQARANDPKPVVNAGSGIEPGGITYITLSGGQVEKVYTITVKVTTNNGLQERRNFKLKVNNRSA